MLQKAECINIFSKLDITMQRAVIAIVLEHKDAKSHHPNWPMQPKQYASIERLKIENDFIHGAAIVAEESGELVRAALKFHYEDGQYYKMQKEAIQCGAMALRFITHSPFLAY